MTAAILEKIVTAEFLTRWGETPLLRREFDPGTGYAALIAELEAARERLMSDRDAGIYDRPADAERFRENVARMGAEIDRLAALPDRPASMAWVPTGQTVADQWHAAADGAERRDILITYEIKVVLYPDAPDYPRRVWVHDLDPVKEADAREAIARAEAEDADSAADAAAAMDAAAEADDAYRASIEDEYQADERDLIDAQAARILRTSEDPDDEPDRP